MVLTWVNSSLKLMCTKYCLRLVFQIWVRVLVREHWILPDIVVVHCLLSFSDSPYDFPSPNSVEEISPRIQPTDIETRPVVPRGYMNEWMNEGWTEWEGWTVALKWSKRERQLGVWEGDECRRSEVNLLIFLCHSPTSSLSGLVSTAFRFQSYSFMNW
jgi:hypothetical protein